MQSSAIRSAFISYFRGQQHQLVSSSSLVPAQDQTLLFTNSGMVQFKDVFLGQKRSEHERAVTVQRCLRAGGKHNDLENVGYTARHHTFFEMMGNFSFGDYFKDEAIAYAWELVTKVFKLPEERLWVTVHHSDKESEDIWLNKIGVSAERFSRLDEDNFWSMGDTGPCGPCSEIFYDHGPGISGGPPGSPDADGDRYVEIWNLVFMQYQRSKSRELTRLTNPSIDTGMGLERIAAVLQNQVSNYDTDLFRPLIARAADLLNCQDINNPSLKVIADHARACCFLLFDGVTPSNEGRGYVLRRIIRRAIRHGYSLGSKDSFFFEMFPTLVTTMDQYSEELNLYKQRITKALHTEEEQFRNTLEQGMNMLGKHLKNLSGNSIAGDTVFRLYDTFGFPVDLTNDIARERGLTLDMQGFNELMKQQQLQSKSDHVFRAVSLDLPMITKVGSFVGYHDFIADTKVLAMVRDGQIVDSLSQGQQGWVVLKQTPFYAESGGQIGDTGSINNDAARALVTGTIKHGDNHWHLVTMDFGTMAVDDSVEASIDDKRRWAIMRNHSATHLLHSALRRHLGDTVMQRGSLVSDEKLRFDFSHHTPISQNQLTVIETEVNDQIMANNPVVVQEMSMDEAKRSDAIAFFEEKYGDKVRVLSMGQFENKIYSVELCGGSHVNSTGDIGSFHIIQETGIASGVRRIEAVTAAGVHNWLRQLEKRLTEATSLLKTDSNNLSSAIAGTIEQNKKLQKQVQDLQARMASGTNGDDQPASIAGIQTIIRRIDDVNPGALRLALDKYKSQLGRGAVFLAGKHNGKVAMIAGVTNNLTDKISAHMWLQSLAGIVDGKAGGRADMAQGGGSDINNIDRLLEQAATNLKKQLQDD